MACGRAAALYSFELFASARRSPRFYACSQLRSMPPHPPFPGEETRLQRALDLHHRFLRGEFGTDADALLSAHRDLADLLAPLLQPETDTPEEDDLPTLGQYRLLHELGRGSMGVVFAAEHTSLGRRVALKILSAPLVHDVRALIRFKREAQLAARLDHAGITRVHDVAEVDGNHFFVMDLVAGVSLQRVTERLRQGPLPHTGKDVGAVVHALLAASDPGGTVAADADAPGWRGSYEACVVELAKQVAEALAHAHGAGIVHRDVKPGNILVRADGTAVLTDFGIARLEDAAGCTLTGDFAGTPSYASPEQVRRSAGVDYRSDIFSLGATLYELLTLRKPFDGDTIAETTALILKHEPRPPRRLNARVSRDLEAVVQHALEKEPAARYQSAAALADDLDRVLRGRPVRVRPVTRGVMLARWMRRNPLAASFVATTSAAALTVAVLALTVQAKERVAVERLDQFRTVRLLRELQLARRMLETAPPPLPENVAELSARVGSVRALVERLPAMRERLVALAQMGSARATRDPDRLLAVHPAQARLDTLQAGAESMRRVLDDDRAQGAVSPEWDAVMARRLEQLTAETAELQAQVDRRRSLDFADAETEFLHDTVEDLIAELEWIGARLLPELEGRLAWAQEVTARTVTAHEREWREAVAFAAQSPRYRDLHLTPQVGLVPLGHDSRSGLLEFAHLRSGTVPARAGDGTLQLDDGSAIVLVLVPGGHARIGTAEDPADPRYDDLASEDELPILEVDLAPFFLSKYELAHGQWNRMAAGLGAQHQAFELEARPGFERKPIVRVDWFACEDVCRAHALTFPTEAQWEHACRGLKTTPWWTGSDVQSLRAAENIAPEEGKPRGRLRVDTGAPNPFGLHHMHGNVQEWCLDPLVKAGGTLRAGDGLREGPIDGELRALRGGAYKDEPRLARAGKRNSYGARAQMQVLGLRPCMPLR